MLKTEKERVVAELTERLKASETLMVADYRGLDVTQLNDVRTELLKHGARFSVVKNTLAKRAAEEAGVSDLVAMLDGPTAIAFVGDGDMVAIAKALSDAARETKVLTVKGGMLDGEPITAEQVKNLGQPAARGRAAQPGPRGDRRPDGLRRRDLHRTAARLRRRGGRAHSPARRAGRGRRASGRGDPARRARGARPRPRRGRGAAEPAGRGAEPTEEPAAEAEGARRGTARSRAEAEAETTDEEPADEAEPETKEEEE